MRAITKSDVVLFVLDARMPELSQNKDLENKLEASGKEFILVFNKIDLVSRERLAELMKEYPHAHFVSVVKKKGFTELRRDLLAKGKKMNVKLEIGIVGYPNVGKSALTNMLLRSHKSHVSSKAGTTKGVQWASSNAFRIVDSPGVIPWEDDEVKLGLLSAKNPEKLKDPEAVALKIISTFSEGEISKLEKFYGFNASAEEEDYEVMIKIGMAKKLLRKGGVVDEGRTALMIIRDWQGGKLRL